MGSSSLNKRGVIQHDVTSAEVQAVPALPNVDSVVHVESISVQSPEINKLVIDTSLVVLSTPRNIPASSSIITHRPTPRSVTNTLLSVEPTSMSAVPKVQSSIPVGLGHGLTVPTQSASISRVLPSVIPSSGVAGSVPTSVDLFSRTVSPVSGTVLGGSGTIPVTSSSSRRIPFLFGPVSRKFSEVPTSHSDQTTSHFSKVNKPAPASWKPGIDFEVPKIHSSGSAFASGSTCVPAIGLVSAPPGFSPRPRPKLSRSKIVTHEYIPDPKVDKSTNAVISRVNKGTSTSSLSSSSSVSLGSSKVPALQSSSSSFLVVSCHEPSTGSNSQPAPSPVSRLPPSPSAHAKSSRSPSPEPDLGGDDSDSADSCIEVLDDPSDDLMQVSKVYSKLKLRIVSKYVEVKKEEKISELSPFQLAFEKKRPASPKFKMGSSVLARMAALDKELEKKRSLASSVALFQPFLKKKDLKFYKTNSELDVSAPDSVLALLTGILDQSRLKNLKSSKVSFSLSEMDSLIKSLFHLLEVLSFSSSSFEILGECFMDLRNLLTNDLKPKALEYTSFLRCVDKASRHSIGEAVNLFANMLIKKREHILSLSFSSVPQAFKSKVVFSPLSEFRLLPIKSVSETADQFRKQSETSALASMVSIAKASSKSKNFFRGAGSSSSSQTSKGKSTNRGGTSKSGSKSSYSARNRDFFNRRDRIVKGSKKPSQQTSKKE